MKKLNNYIKKYYKNQEKKYNVDEIIVSGSDQKGEGEHKIFNYIRKWNKTQTTNNDYLWIRRGFNYVGFK